MWKTIHQSGVIASKDGFIYTSDALLGRLPVLVEPEAVTVGIYSDGSFRTVPGYRLSLTGVGTLIKVDPSKADLQPMGHGDSEWSARETGSSA